MFCVNLFEDKQLPPLDTLYLPLFRINCNHAFEHVGVDYTAPVFYKNVKKQSTKLLRKWITNNENLQHRINEHGIDCKPTDDYQQVLGLNRDYKMMKLSLILVR